MNNFKIVKKGYSQLEVDSYIEKLKEDYESRLAEQKDRIFYLKDQLDKITNSSDNELVTTLVGAVERARIIETSSKNIYELETKKLSLLYTKMENLLQDENIRNDRSVKQELLLLIKDCRRSLESNITAQSENIKESTSGDPVKTLLSKMIDFNKVTADYMLTKKQAKIKEENDKKIIKIIPTNEVIRKEVPSSVRVVQVRRTETQETKEKQAQNVLTNNVTVNEFDKFLSQNNEINGANFENIMFTKNSANSSRSSSIARRRERIRENRAISRGQSRSSLASQESTNSRDEKSAKLQSRTEERSSSKLQEKELTSSKQKSNSSTKIFDEELSSKTQKSEISKSSQNSRLEKENADTSSSKTTLNKDKSSTKTSLYDMESYSNEVNSKSSSSSNSKDYSSISKESKKTRTESANSYSTSKYQNSDDVVSSRSKSREDSSKDDLSALGIGASIFTASKSKNSDNANGNLKTESKSFEVSGTRGNTNYSASASYQSASYSSSTSSSTSNPNDELSDEEFLRAYLGDLEEEEAQREQGIKSTTKTTQSFSSSSSSFSSSTTRRSSNSAYVTGGRVGDYSPNETGFDLKEAINPKEDLDEIMKAFDFFNDNKKKK